jgi:hypothetical protein
MAENGEKSVSLADQNEGALGCIRNRGYPTGYHATRHLAPGQINVSGGPNSGFWRPL